ncbi:hypothetical protein OnM2_026072 [Erysiphe neolycopersici]|uniref:MARVEL domain-containing protein n=1 Tax=Erysiphe neolycopersici TaxID=212602 RepID=A0A420I0X1_9PEZI|nr:hypothetical protein OnM2_026072 [Erysiphe neolycopersici]
MGLSFNVELQLTYICHLIGRTIQLILALTVCGLYGLNISSRNHERWQSRWDTNNSQIFAEVIAGLSAITALLYAIPLISRIPFVFLWDTILFLLWIAVFGLFGHMYINIDPLGNSRIQRMKNAVWIDLANAICWLISAIGMAIFWYWRKRKSTYTGRAIV